MSFRPFPQIILRVFSLVCLLMFILYSEPRSGAQVAGATVSGRVADPSGAVISDANVAVTNAATNVVRTARTDQAGFYSVPNLLPGTYTIRVTAQGFAEVTDRGVTLAVGAQQTMNVTLQLGTVGQQVVVTSAAESIQLSSSELSAEVNPTTMRELPLNGRDWTQLATLQPGVAAVQAQAASSGVSSRGNRGFGNQLTDDGHRPSENNYRVNGISINDYTNGSPGSALGVQLGVDAIDEFSILTTNYSAEYGRTSGGVVNAITKSGTNELHGTAYWFLRDDALDARNYFDSSQNPPFHRNQFGASAGAPLRKDKLFAFADYEGIRQDQSLSFHDLVPSSAARSGNLCSSPSTGACTPSTITVDPAVAPYLNFYPLPNAGLSPGGNGDTGFFDGNGLAPLEENYVITRIDNTISSKDSYDISGFCDTSYLAQPDALLVGVHEVNSRRYMGSGEENHIFSPTLTNAVRGGYSRTQGIVNQPLHAINPLAGESGLGAIPGKNAPTLTVPGLTQMAGSLGSPAYSHHTQNSFQGYDDAFLTVGPHSLRFGFAVEHLQYNVTHESGPTGNFNFPSLAGFLENKPTSVSALLPGSSRELGARQTLFGVYLQDDWHLFSNLTINAGIRYEPTTMPGEVHNSFEVIPSLSTPSAAVPVSSPWQTNQTLRNFEPRLGFSWDPFKNGKTAIRAGAGIFDVLPLPWEYAFNSASAFPFGEKGSASHLPAGSFPHAAISLIAANPTKFQEMYFEPHPHANYALNWNFNIQQQLSSTAAATIGYVGTHTLHQPFIMSDANEAMPAQQTPEGYLWPCDQTVSGIPATPCTGTESRINSEVGAIIATFWDDTASYNGFQASVNKTMSHNFQAQGSYTWSKCEDEGTSGAVADPFSTSLTSLIWFDRQARAGLCDFDQSQNFVGNYVWKLPTLESKPLLARGIVGGWELDGILTLTTGAPTTLVIGGDPLGQGSSDTYNVPDRLRGSGCSANPANSGNVSSYFKLQCFSVPIAPQALASMCQPGFSGQTDSSGNPIPISGSCMNLFGNSGRSSVIGPGLLDFDSSVFKNIPLSKIEKGMSAQFRAEFFNVLNHSNFLVPNFASGNDVLFNQNGTPVGGAGAINATSTTSRQIQLGLKLLW